MTSTMPSVAIKAEDDGSNFGLKDESGVIDVAERLSEEFDAEVALSGIETGVEVPVESGLESVVPVQEDVAGNPLLAVIIEGDPDDWDEKTLASAVNDTDPDELNENDEKAHLGMSFPDDLEGPPTEPDFPEFDLYGDTDDKIPDTIRNL